MKLFPYLKFKLGLLGKTWNPNHQTKWDLFIINTGLHIVTHELRLGQMIRSGFDHIFFGTIKVMRVWMNCTAAGGKKLHIQLLK